MPVFFWLPFILLSGMMSLGNAPTPPDSEREPSQTLEP